MRRRVKFSGFCLQGGMSCSAFMFLFMSLVLKLWKGGGRNGYEINPGLISIALAQGLTMVLTMIRSTGLTVTAELSFLWRESSSQS